MTTKAEKILVEELEEVNKQMQWYVKADKENPNAEWLKCEGYYQWLAKKHLIQKLLRKLKN